MKIFLILGTRPEIVRLSSVIRICKKHFDAFLIHTGQNYDYSLNEVFFKDLDLDPPDYYLGITGKHVGEMVGHIISETFTLFQKEKPDLIVILGDTNSCLCAYSAKRLKIPVIHLEAGNRAFDPNLPEELNRKIIDHISDVNICYQEHSRRFLLAENISPQFLFVVGSPIPEVFQYIEPKINSSSILKTLELEPQEYFLWSTHREDNIDVEANFFDMIECLERLATEYKKKIIFGVHPRTKKKMDQHKIVLNQNIILTEPFGILDFYMLMKNACCTISDSGTLTEETNILKCKGILYRYSTEHPEGIDNGSIVIGNLQWIHLNNALKVVLAEPVIQSTCTAFSSNDFSQRVVKIILSYPPIINKFKWLKSRHDL